MYVFFFHVYKFHSWWADKITVYLWHDDITNDTHWQLAWRQAVRVDSRFLSTHIQHFSNVVHLLYVFRFPPSVYSLIVWAPMAVLASTEETNKHMTQMLPPPELNWRLRSIKCWSRKRGDIGGGIDWDQMELKKFRLDARGENTTRCRGGPH